MTYIKENIITKLQILDSPPRNLRVDNKLPAQFLKKPFCTGDLFPARKIFIERLDEYKKFFDLLTNKFELEKTKMFQITEKGFYLDQKSWAQKIKTDPKRTNNRYEDRIIEKTNRLEEETEISEINYNDETDSMEDKWIKVRELNI